MCRIEIVHLRFRCLFELPDITSEGSDSVFVSESVPSGPDESRTWTQPEGLSPSVTGSDWVVDHFEGIHIDFQAGELVSPARKLYIHVNQSHDTIRSGL